MSSSPRLNPSLATSKLNHHNTTPYYNSGVLSLPAQYMQHSARAAQDYFANASTSAVAANASGKKKYMCSVCSRGFTTSGHLARHGRIHTGERNHACPFPGCETRCSRQDNLQQQ
ncbi:hypothetical protein NM688_g4148 [Phlebia brevispora]|uniref:Uncharacterized protein n=1 Tax=Phlebia brevispora TaxID=194682 RepID=A0ACC1T3R2_9APHY|nr:hypothetical protein NM688_g4148 [Phlebia brevispora]